MTHISWMIVIAALIAALLQAVSHYFPWRRLLNGRDLPRLAAIAIERNRALLDAALVHKEIVDHV